MDSGITQGPFGSLGTITVLDPNLMATEINSLAELKNLVGFDSRKYRIQADNPDGRKGVVGLFNQAQRLLAFIDNGQDKNRLSAKIMINGTEIVLGRETKASVIALYYRGATKKPEADMEDYSLEGMKTECLGINGEFFNHFSAISFKPPFFLCVEKEEVINDQTGLIHFVNRRGNCLLNAVKQGGRINPVMVELQARDDKNIRQMVDAATALCAALPLRSRFKTHGLELVVNGENYHNDVMAYVKQAMPLRLVA